MTEDVFHLGIKAIIQDKQGRVLLLKVNPSVMHKFIGKPYWDIPGGRITKGSTVEATLKREVEEETGISKIVSFKPFSMVLSNIRIPIRDYDVGLILASYICAVDNYSQVKLSSEHTEAKWFSSDEASKLLEVKYPIEFTEKIKEL